jgi:hypothetical protein
MQSLFDLKEEIGKRIEFAVAAAAAAVAMAEQAGCGCRRPPLYLYPPETTGIR